MSPAPQWAVDDYIAACRKPAAARSRYEERLRDLFLMRFPTHITHEFIAHTFI